MLKHKWSLRVLLVGVAGIMIMTSCQKESSYYLDSGLTKPSFNGTVMDYLDSVSFYFDTVAAIAHLAGVDTILEKDTLTFFAPTDRSIYRLITYTNSVLYSDGYDTIRTLQDVPQVIWRKYLTRYMFHGRNGLKDYPQVDYDLINDYPGQGYLSWDGTPMNIGVVYNDVNGVKYAGYRQLSIAYIPDLSHPLDNWVVAYVASSNIFTNNGAVHVLSDSHTYFGFDQVGFVNDMEAILSTGSTK
ncbi:MAG: hypothetical protein EPN37_01930 [Chitinophagaceae bacterium]|nr:MAG: hypothetical protein EPN37_01930 [Chitinophagaceae bacterium]